MQRFPCTLDRNGDASSTLTAVNTVLDPSLRQSSRRLSNCFSLKKNQMQSGYSSVMFGVAAFSASTSSYDYQVLVPLIVDVYPVVTALGGLATASL